MHFFGGPFGLAFLSPPRGHSKVGVKVTQCFWVRRATGAEGAAVPFGWEGLGVAARPPDTKNSWCPVADSWDTWMG